MREIRTPIAPDATGSWGRQDAPESRSGSSAGPACRSEASRQAVFGVYAQGTGPRGMYHEKTAGLPDALQARRAAMLARYAEAAESGEDLPFQRYYLADSHIDEDRR